MHSSVGGVLVAETLHTGKKLVIDVPIAIDPNDSKLEYTKII